MPRTNAMNSISESTVGKLSTKVRAQLVFAMLLKAKPILPAKNHQKSGVFKALNFGSPELPNFNRAGHRVTRPSSSVQGWPRCCVKEDGDGYRAWSLVAVKSPNLVAGAWHGMAEIRLVTLGQFSIGPAHDFMAFTA